MDIRNMTITTRLDNALNGLQDEFRGLYDSNDFRLAVEDLADAEGRPKDNIRPTSDYPSRLRTLYEMFDVCGIPYEKNRDSAYYRQLIATAGVPTHEDIEDRMILALLHRFEEYPSPEEYMKRLVDKLKGEDDPWKDDTLRVRILKQFCKYADGLTAAGYQGKATVKNYAVSKGYRTAHKDIDELLSYVDDGVFDVLETATRDQRKPKGTYGLLKAVDDLALGKFRTEGSTKVLLYLFAMAFDMTYYSGADGGPEIYDRWTDIDRNLFQDYYTNNFIRFITDAYRGKLNEYELDPSGQGINYKNYAEMVYLYYIVRDMSPADKIKSASEMIRRIKTRMANKGYSPADDNSGMNFSDRFRAYIIRQNSLILHSEYILSMKEDDFEEFLCRNYNCDATKANNSPIMLETSQNTAFDAYLEILSEIEDTGTSIDNCNYGLWFTDVAGIYSRNRTLNVQEADQARLGRFLELLKGVNSYLGVTADEKDVDTEDESKEKTSLSVAKTKALHIDSPGAVTRASMVAAYYYLFNAVHEDDDMYGSRSFEEVFEEFRTGINKYLGRAHYNLFSGRDLFDVMTAFSSYAFIYM